MVSFPRSTLSPGSGVVLCHAASMAALLLAATTFLLRPVPASAQGVTGQETNGTSSGSRRGLQVQNVRCWCGDKESKELDIQRIGDKACGKLSLDPGSGAKGNRQGRNLVVKARRKMLTLKISPTVMGRHQRKARSSGFYLKFSRRKNEQKREKGKHRACYKVSIRGKAERKKCRNQKLQCAAVLHKRPRFLTSAIFTRSGRRHKLVGVDRVNRRKQQRTGSDESGQSKRRRRSHAHGERRMRNIQSTSPASTSTCHPQGYKNCGEWRPNIVAVSRGSDVEVRYSPRNCFATEIELTIQRGYVIVSKQTLSPDKFELTFRNIRPGDYKAAVRPMGPECSGFSDIIKPFVVKDDSPQTTSGGMVSDGFNEVTTPTRDSCYHWHTSVELKQTSDGPNVLEVRYKTSNLTGASRVEVALERSDYRIMDHKMIGPDQEKVRFTVNKAGEYKAYVKPHGCRDCTDFKRYGDNCDAAYITSNVVSVDVNSLRTMSTSQTQTSWMDDDATSSNDIDDTSDGTSNANDHRREPYALASHSCNCDHCCRFCRGGSKM